MRQIASTALFLALLTGCTQTPGTTTSTAPAAVAAPEQTATVKLRDGGTFTGIVKSSDANAITLQAPGGESRTYPMTQVATVNYRAPGAAQPVPARAEPVRTAAANAPEAKPEPARAAARVQEVYTVPSGVVLEIRNNEAIDSQTARPNQTFSAVVARDITDDQGRVAVPKGANATLLVREVSAQGKIKGQSELVLDVASVEVAGRSYQLETRDLTEKGKDGIGANQRTAVYTGGAAAVGSIIGAIAGGAKGAAIGAASGAAAGGGVQTITRGKSVRVAPETILRFTLEQPLQIRRVP